MQKKNGELLLVSLFLCEGRTQIQAYVESKNIKESEEKRYCSQSKMGSFLEFLKASKGHQTLDEGLRLSKNGEMIDLEKDSAQFMDFSEEKFPDENYPFINGEDRELPCIYIEPKHKIFSRQTQMLAAFFCGYDNMSKVIGLHLKTPDGEEPDPLYADKVFFPTRNDIVKIVLTCTDKKQFNTELLRAFTKNFNDLFNRSNASFVESDAESHKDVVVKINVPNYADELYWLFNGQYAQGIPTSPGIHGVNAKNHSERFNIMKKLVAKNHGDFGSVQAVVMAGDKTRLVSKHKMYNLVLMDGLLVVVDPSRV